MTTEAKATKKKAAPAKKAAKKVTKKAAKKVTKKAKTETRGRTCQFAGMKITKLVKENPRREGTIGHASFELIENGMTYEAFIEAGGRWQDLVWDVEHEHVKVA